MAAEENGDVPPEAVRMLAGRTRETKIRRDAQGRWFNDGEPITHLLLTQAFDAWIERAPDGRYCLKNDINWAYVQIDGPPLFVRQIEIAEEGADRTVALHLSDGRIEILDPATLRQGMDGALYCTSERQGLAAQLTNHAALRLGELLEEDADGVYLRLGAAIVRPPVLERPIEAGLPIGPEEPTPANP